MPNDPMTPNHNNQESPATPGAPMRPRQPMFLTPEQNNNLITPGAPFRGSFFDSPSNNRLDNVHRNLLNDFNSDIAQSTPTTERRSNAQYMSPDYSSDDSMNNGYDSDDSMSSVARKLF